MVPSSTKIILIIQPSRIFGSCYQLASSSTVDFVRGLPIFPSCIHMSHMMGLMSVMGESSISLNTIKTHSIILRACSTLDRAQRPITLPCPIWIGWIDYKHTLQSIHSTQSRSAETYPTTLSHRDWDLPVHTCWSTGWDMNPWLWGLKPQAWPLGQWISLNAIKLPRFTWLHIASKLIKLLASPASNSSSFRILCKVPLGTVVPAFLPSHCTKFRIQWLPHHVFLSLQSLMPPLNPLSYHQC